MLGEQVFQRQMSKEGLQSVVNSTSGPASNAVSSEVSPAARCSEQGLTCLTLMWTPSAHL